MTSAARAVLIRGGTVLTMAPGREVLEGVDVLIRGGRIAAIGRGLSVDDPSLGGRRAHPLTEVLDARGAAVVPGFVQSHVHLCQVLFRGMADELPLMRWLRERIWPLEGAHDRRSLRASAKLGVLELLRGGTTTILDMGTVHHHDVVFEVMRDAGIRGASGKAMMDVGAGVPKGLRESRVESLRESERLCRRWHRAADDRLRYAFAPRFILSCSKRLLREVGERAAALDALVHSHAAEHPGERDEVRKIHGADDVDALEGLGLSGPGVILAHGVQLTKKQMRRMAQLGTRVVHCPSANLKLASGIADVVAMREAGLVVGLGADGAPCNNRLDVFTELRSAALLAKVKRNDAAALSPMDALAMATIDGAKALGWDDAIGSIEVGKRADITVVDIEGTHALPAGDAVTRLVYSCTAADVRHVLVDGRVLVRRGEVEALDVAKVHAQARTEAKRVLGRAALD